MSSWSELIVEAFFIFLVVAVLGVCQYIDGLNKPK